VQRLQVLVQELQVQGPGSVDLVALGQDIHMGLVPLEQYCHHQCIDLKIVSAVNVRWGISPLGEALSFGVGPKPMEMELLFGVLGFNCGNLGQSPVWSPVVISQVYNTHVPSFKLVSIIIIQQGMVEILKNMVVLTVIWVYIPHILSVSWCAVQILEVHCTSNDLFDPERPSKLH
jgi:hypothetical protein